MSVGESQKSGAAVMSRAQQVYLQLLDDISEGRWRATETVSTYALAARLGVSRTPVAEALKRLESDGLVEILPKVGCRLTISPPEASAEVFALAGSVLALAAERATHLVDDAALARMDALIDQLEAAAERHDAAEVRRVVDEMPRELLRAGLPAHAQVGEGVLRALAAELRRSTDLRLGPTAISDKRVIVDALRARSPQRARAAVQRHFADVTARALPSPPSRRPDREHDCGTLEHAAVLYRSRAEFIASVLPFVLGGLQGDEQVLVVSHIENLEALGRALGTDGTAVDYRESGQWYADPASALRSYRQYIDGRGAGTRVRIVGEPPWRDRTEVGVAGWLRYESVINVVLESAPATIVCPYDARRLPQEIVRGARAAHPSLCTVAGLTPSPDYRAFFATTAT